MKWLSITNYVDLETCVNIPGKESEIMKNYYIVTKPVRHINYGKKCGYITYTYGVRKRPTQGTLSFDRKRTNGGNPV